MLRNVEVDTKNLAKTLREVAEKAAYALPRMASSILVESKMKAPLREGYLRDSARVTNRPGESEVRYGNHGQVPYAAYQERGSTTGTPWNYTTPGTGPHFLEDATNNVVRKGIGQFA